MLTGRHLSSTSVSLSWVDIIICMTAEGLAFFLYVCVCLCMLVCLCDVCMSVCVYVCLCVCLSVCISVCVHVCLYVCLSISVSLCGVCMSVCVYGCLCSVFVCHCTCTTESHRRSQRRCPHHKYHLNYGVVRQCCDEPQDSTVGQGPSKYQPSSKAVTTKRQELLSTL